VRWAIGQARLVGSRGRGGFTDCGSARPASTWSPAPPARSSSSAPPSPHRTRSD